MSTLISLLSAVVRLLETMIRGGDDGHARPGRHSNRTARGDVRRVKRRTGRGRACPVDGVTFGLVAIAILAILAVIAVAVRIGPVPDRATHTPVAAPAIVTEFPRIVGRTVRSAVAHQEGDQFGPRDRPRPSRVRPQVDRHRAPSHRGSRARASPETRRRADRHRDPSHRGPRGAVGDGAGRR